MGKPSADRKKRESCQDIYGNKKKKRILVKAEWYMHFLGDHVV